MYDNDNEELSPAEVSARSGATKDLVAIMGSAGTGKTTEVQKRLEVDSKYGVVTATTGIAAVNMSKGLGGDGGVVTINSMLGYSDMDSMEEAYASGGLVRNLLRIRRTHKRLIVDEMSMMNAKALDLLVKALDKVNEQEQVKSVGGLGLVLVGDFCQLPPVRDRFIRDLNHPINKYAFEAECWPRFKVERLTKIWRQDNLEFLEAINAARAGDGETSARVLEKLRVFTDHYDVDFPGVTILPTNKQVNALNEVRLQQLVGNGARKIVDASYRWGKQRIEWKQNVPEFLEVAVGAYVMILINDIAGGMRYANGSCGWVKDKDNSHFYVKLENGQEVEVPRIVRQMYQKEEPEGFVTPKYLSKGDFCNAYTIEHDIRLSGEQATEQYKAYLANLTKQYRYKWRVGNDPSPFFDFERKRWVVGEVVYFPIRLAYALTVHKTQGLTLDHVQINPYNGFFSEPAMAYVALSRCRSHEGLKVYGGKGLWEQRCNAAAEVIQWV